MFCNFSPHPQPYLRLLVSYLARSEELHYLLEALLCGKHQSCLARLVGLEQQGQVVALKTGQSWWSGACTQIMALKSCINWLS